MITKNINYLAQGVSWLLYQYVYTLTVRFFLVLKLVKCGSEAVNTSHLSPVAKVIGRDCLSIRQVPNT